MIRAAHLLLALLLLAPSGCAAAKAVLGGIYAQDESFRNMQQATGDKTWGQTDRKGGWW
jgi:hypothetical protein